MAARAAKRKRGSAPVSPPSDGPAARRARGSGGGGASGRAAVEVKVESGECGEWATAMKAARDEGQLIDFALCAGGLKIDAHKLVLISLSPYLRGLLTSGLAESAAQSEELTLQDMDGCGRAVEAVVNCMYSGKLSLSIYTVTSLIRVANILQVGPVEKAAGEFFVSRLEPSTAADALRFAAERVECGEHAAALHDKCVEYAIEHFAALSREATFLGLPDRTVALLIGSDELHVDESDVLAAVRFWFEHDAEGRKESLKAVMPLVRWPRLPADVRRGLCDDPLFKYLLHLDDESKVLGLKLMLECGAAKSADSIIGDCPRFKCRKGQGQEFVFQGVDNTVDRNGKFDTSGLLHHIATEGGTSEWTNPHEAGRVAAALSEMHPQPDRGCGPPSFVSGPAQKLMNYTSRKPNSWMAVDLKAGRRLIVNHYALRNCRGANTSKWTLRNWELQGADRLDGPWTTLRRHDDDQTIGQEAKSFAAAWAVEAAQPFQVFRIHQHGQNAADGDGLACAGIELYGTLIEG